MRDRAARLEGLAHDRRGSQSNKQRIALADVRAASRTSRGRLHLVPNWKGMHSRPPLNLVHHFLYYAQVCVTEGATMASECAVLGTRRQST